MPRFEHLTKINRRISHVLRNIVQGYGFFKVSIHICDLVLGYCQIADRAAVRRTEAKRREYDRLKDQASNPLKILVISIDFVVKKRKHLRKPLTFFRIDALELLAYDKPKLFFANLIQEKVGKLNGINLIESSGFLIDTVLMEITLTHSDERSGLEGNHRTVDDMTRVAAIQKEVDLIAVMRVSWNIHRISDKITVNQTFSRKR